MLNTDDVFRLLRAGNAHEVHSQLDADSVGMTPEVRHKIAHWRTSALLWEKRYEEALDHLEQSKIHYGCKTLAFHDRARIFSGLDRHIEALKELQCAPLSEELEKYYALVLDAKFFLLYLIAKNGFPVGSDVLDEIPDGYMSVLPSDTHLYGLHMSKTDLVAMIDASSGRITKSI